MYDMRNEGRRGLCDRTRTAGSIKRYSRAGERVVRGRYGERDIACIVSLGV